MAFKAVIFDLDGTLLNTIEDIADAVNAVLAKEGCPPHSIEQYKIIVGTGVEHMMEQALPHDRRDQETIVRCAAGIRRQYEVYGHIKTKPYDGVPELLDELARRGIKLGVHTNKPHENALHQLNHYFPKVRFERAEGAKADVPTKPDPAVTLDIARSMGVAPAECIFIGDSDIDMQTAVNAGMYGVGATWGFRSHEELEAHGAQVLLERPIDMLTLF